jgi:hypothetical protein
MKLNRKIVVLNVLATCLFTQAAMAERLGAKRTPVESNGGSDNGRPGRPIKTSKEVEEQSQTIKAVGEKCSGDQSEERSFPLSMMSLLTRDGDSIQIEKRSNNSIVVKIPPMLSVCGSFTPVMKQGVDTKNVTILMKLIKDGKELSYKEFEDCVKSKPFFVDGKIDHDKLSGKDYESAVYPFTYDFDKKKDIQKSITVNFGYPVAYQDPKNGYDPLFGLTANSDKVPGEKCMVMEKVAEEPVLLNKGKEDIIAEINKICESGTAQEIADARNRLGNADALKDIADKIKEEMDAGYLAKAKIEAEQIYKDMKAIEDKLSENRDSISERDVRKKVAEYAELAKKLNKTFLSPAIYRLDSLIQKRLAVKDEDSKEARDLDAEIKKLNNDIKVFSTHARNMASMNDLISKFAIIDEAKVIEDVYQTSALYSSVYVGKDPERGKARTFEEARTAQINNMKKFDKATMEMSDIYQVGKGNTAPLLRAQKEQKAIADRASARYSAFMTKENAAYQSACGTGMLGYQKNASACSTFMTGFQKRREAEIKRLNADAANINAKGTVISKMTSNYNEFTSRKVAEASSNGDSTDDRWGTSTSYSNYEESFSDRFPEYSNSGTSTANTNFTFGGTNAAMQMGQQTNQFVQQQQVAGAQNGYQYQMQPQQTQQTSGWVGI